MADVKAKRARRTRRHHSITRKISGSTERPRLVVFRSLKGIYAQVVDDSVGRTLVSAGTNSKELKDLPKGTKTAAAGAVGALLAQKALAAGIKKISFDRAGYKFHGRVKALADAARKAGLEF
ncbi:MAG: 50S ribosomal protein L18 [Planctomycetes bacterium]|nr:50S ribosomal protein L18 [Planctomycetota bacterium]